jgi:MYXO-CTERM domain-containing protein
VILRLSCEHLADAIDLAAVRLNPRIDGQPSAFASRPTHAACTPGRAYRRARLLSSPLMFASGAPLALLALLTAGAVTDRPRPPAPIYGGEAVEPGAWPGVVALEIASGGGLLICTGTLIHERLVLTAAHCITPGIAPSKIRVLLGDTVPEATFQTSASDYGIHPQFCADTETCKQDVYDFAWVKLTDPAPAPTAPILLRQDQWDHAMAVGAPVTLVGYGYDEKGLQGVKRIAETTITALSDTGLEFRAGGMGVDSCQGDSGGPAFVKSPGGTYLLAGVTSRGYACGEGGFYGVPYTILCWASEGAGVDVSPPACAACDCLNTTGEEEGCGCRAPAPAAPGPLALLSAVGLAWLSARRRR